MKQKARCLGKFAVTGRPTGMCQALRERGRHTQAGGEGSENNKKERARWGRGEGQERGPLTKQHRRLGGKASIHKESDWPRPGQDSDLSHTQQATQLKDSGKPMPTSHTAVRGHDLAPRVSSLLLWPQLPLYSPGLPACLHNTSNTISSVFF